MKTCQKCGTVCSDADKFCTACGAALSAADSAVNAQPPKPEYQPAQTKAASANGLSLKELAGSKLALRIAIAFTLIVLLAMVSSFVVPRTLSGYVDDAAQLLEGYDIGEIDLSDIDLSELEEFGIDLGSLDLEHLQLQDIVDSTKGAVKDALANAGSVFSAIRNNFTGILIAVCMWLIYFTAADSDTPVCSSTAFTILHVLKALALAGAILLALVIAFAGAFAISSCSEETKPIAIAITAVLAVILMLAILYRVGLVRTLKRFEGEAKGVSNKGHLSGFAGFVLAVKGVFECLAVPVAAVLVYIVGSAAVPALVSAIASAAAYFGCSKFIFRAKKALSN